MLTKENPDLIDLIKVDNMLTKLIKEDSDLIDSIKGDKGDPGKPGDKGDPGDQGKPGDFYGKVRNKRAETMVQPRVMIIAQVRNGKDLEVHASAQELLRVKEPMIIFHAAKSLIEPPNPMSSLGAVNFS